MNSKTEEFLNVLLWSAEMLSRPTFRNLTDSYESWAYRRGFQKQVSRLEKQKLIEREEAVGKSRLYRLTGEGRVLALGGRDPQVAWARPWDGKWRLVVFDVPVVRNDDRKRLRRYLSARSFGCLQNSVWVTPNAVEAERQILGQAKVDVQSLLLLEARPCAGESDLEIVEGAWDFKRINHRYECYFEILARRPTGVIESKAAGSALQRWAASEWESWLGAVTNDPLLPQELLPAGYLGQEAWRRRVKALGEAAKQMRTFLK